ncbi:MAG: DUF2087 domain-containing protein [Candidatus Eisenbacteria bacterium]
MEAPARGRLSAGDAARALHLLRARSQGAAARGRAGGEARAGAGIRRRVGAPRGAAARAQRLFEGTAPEVDSAQRRKKEIVLEELPAPALARKREYQERELSLWLKAIHEDFCTLRREFLIGVLA